MDDILGALIHWHLLFLFCDTLHELRDNASYAYQISINYLQS